jgi:HK97 family phage prohead protease
MTIVRLDGAPASLTVPETRNLTAPVADVKWREDDGKLIFVGHAGVFDRLSEDLGGFRERIQRGAWRKVLDLTPDVRFLEHNHGGWPLARTANGTLELREDPKGLRVYAELAPTTGARDLQILVKRGDISQMSFGFGLNYNDGGRDVWTEEDGVLVRTIVTFSALYDVSPVTFPAYVQTDASMRALGGGVEVVADDGQVRAEPLRDVADRIFRGDLQVTREERAAIDAAFSRIDQVSPWTAERAARASSQEPGSRGHAHGKGETAVVDDETAGQHFRLAARQRRLRALAGHGA